MAVIYMHLDYEGYKALEGQCRAFKESTHKSTGGFYHKSLRIRMGSDLIIEFHGPLVGGYGHDAAPTHAPIKPPMSVEEAERKRFVEDELPL